MEAIILCGGRGTRLSEETSLKPKPMVEIGGKPILWHIMQRYAHYGYQDFFIALGYKAEVIKNFFSHSVLQSSILLLIFQAFSWRSTISTDLNAKSP